ncbi:2-oxo acid dehydrogenase subunit E2 [Nocardia asteroides]|uniref:2-oxo acid dehydrogenase subunit E2 n=1 Tax=Nocardia asteroides TaxID=1824 RepID=UPI00365A35E9
MLSGGTLTDTGSRGALFDTPVLSRPEVGILGTGAVVERVVPRRDSGGAVSSECGPWRIYRSRTAIASSLCRCTAASAAFRSRL